MIRIAILVKVIIIKLKIWAIGMKNLIKINIIIVYFPLALSQTVLILLAMKSMLSINAS